MSEVLKIEILKIGFVDKGASYDNLDKVEGGCLDSLLTISGKTRWFRSNGCFRGYGVTTYDCQQSVDFLKDAVKDRFQE